ncbi:MAG TPA: hypothetical protein VM846_18195 [Vicinamibacterales bacterium]|nr:hypothetical protein [Vicinamibacterales bacterium]
MRRAVALLLVMGVFTPVLMARQAARGAGTPARPSACALLTKELVTQVTPYDKQTLAGVLGVRPIEDPIGQSGSACSYGGITMQIDPFPFATLEKQRTPAWAAVPGVGDAAYFRDNRGEWGELYVRSDTHVLTIQMDVPTGKTAASIQSNTVALAKAILPKLK